jgi:hypothetical protein
MMVTVVATSLGFVDETQRKNRQCAQTDQDLLHQKTLLEKTVGSIAPHTEARARPVSLPGRQGMARGKIDRGPLVRWAVTVNK